jgi:hypothetical protein
MNEGKKDRRDPIRTVKPRNFVAKNASATTSGAGAHKDKKKAAKQGEVKHKNKEYAEGLQTKLNVALAEAGSPAQQAAIAINMKKHHQKPKSENVDQDEYSDEAGMSYGSLHTIARAATGLLDTIQDGDNLPEWCQEKISLAEDYLVTVWDYLQSEKEQGMAEGVDIGQEWMSDTELDQYVPERLQQQWRELLGYDRNGNPSALWANLTGGYEPDVNDPQHRRLMVKVANKWFTAKKIPNVKFFNVKDADDELEWLVQIGQQGVAEDWNKVNHHDKTNGLSQKAVNAYRREHPGSKLKTAVTTKPSKLKPGSKAAKRRKSFCARMSGNKGPMKKPNGKPTPKALALRRWNCESIEEMQQLIMLGEQYISNLKEAGSPAQQAAIAINMKKNHKKPKK